MFMLQNNNIDAMDAILHQNSSVIKRKIKTFHLLAQTFKISLQSLVYPLNDMLGTN